MCTKVPITDGRIDEFLFCNTYVLSRTVDRLRNRHVRIAKLLKIEVYDFACRRFVLAIFFVINRVRTRTS